MQNDLIIFEFENANNREVLLNPNLVPAIATQLISALDGMRKIAMNRADRGEAQFVPGGSIEIYLAGAERGSVKLAFKAVVAALQRDDVNKPMSTIANGAKVIGYLAAGLVFAGAASGILTPVIPEPERHGEIAFELGAEAASNAQTMVLLERLAEVARKSGADRVIIRVPDAPSCLIEQNVDRNPSLVGSLADTDQTIGFDGTAHGHLLLGDETMLADIDEAQSMMDREAVLYTGSLDVGNARIKVLVEWRSKREVPLGRKDRVRVTGKLVPIAQANITPLGAVPAAARRASALLIVQTQVVEE